MSAVLTPSFIHNQPYGGLVPNGGTFPFVNAMQNTERDIEGTNFQFKILTNPYDIDEAMRLRYEIFCEKMGWQIHQKIMVGRIPMTLTRTVFTLLLLKMIESSRMQGLSFLATSSRSNKGVVFFRAYLTEIIPLKSHVALL